VAPRFLSAFPLLFLYFILFPSLQKLMFVTKPRLFLKYVFENRFAVPSFNVSNLEMVRAVVEAAKLEDAPVMIQTDFINFNYGGMDELYSLVCSLAEPANVPVLLHQDHPGKDYNI